MGARTDTPSLHATFYMFLHVIFVVSSSEASELEALLKLKASLHPNDALISWNGSTPPCSEHNVNWVGVNCGKGKVKGLRLENMGLNGFIDVDLLALLSNLRTISFMKNNFDGPLPDLKKLSALRSVYLSNNNFSGEIPYDAFSGMLRLKKVHLAHNQFAGSIPTSLITLPNLLELRLEDNHFDGQIPDFQQKSLSAFNVSGNELEGPIPKSLSGMDSSCFSGNLELCGKPMGNCDEGSIPSILVIVILATMATIGIGIVVFINHKRQPSLLTKAPVQPSNLQKKSGIKESNESGQDSINRSGNTKKVENVKLTFVREDRERFDMQELLKASAEILGSGSFGSSYKAALHNGQVMVVKRFKQMNNLGKEEFQEHMSKLGKLRHPNLLPLVAYYYRKEEKLLAFDYVPKANLAVHLHVHEALGQPSLDWPTRLKIVKGIAKSLQYMCNALPNLIAPHGHLKSSNVLLNESFDPLLTDYGLIPLINQEDARDIMVVYKSPEYLQQGRITKKTDVWSFGLLILEILTGKFPTNILQQGKGNEEEDLSVTWVNSVVPEEWTNKVFDKEMGATRNSEGEMHKLLKIGLACCERNVEKRWDLNEVVEKIEELVEREDMEEEFYTSYASTEVGSTRGLSADFQLSMHDE
ncbi:pollen receptor-like kinase 1 isoform X1 [Carya illinoinensis]|uniref:non-specific serine/threonine protein kinase n=1 Tax=Carya illinoinensis TaxID=32201 RepID=A0A922A798_CARIL|nr:pollen receptor-like kinase 1 isoform X1 [Carya illinoinensis]KAG6676222.1 hypothetical protein I3842_15G141200 [Carya illinoinensis]